MAGLISDAELTQLRATAESSFDRTVTLQRPSASQDIFARDIFTPATVGTLACRLSTPSAKLLQQFQALIGNVPIWILTYSTSADVRQGDWIVDGSDTLKIHTLLQPHSYRTAARAVVAELK